MDVLVMLAQGVEEIEATIIIDVLRRAQWRVESVGLDDRVVVGSRGVNLVPDTTLDEIRPDDFNMVVIPGGVGGKDRLCSDERVLEMIRDFARHDKWIGAVCAGPLVLQAAGILQGCNMTCYPELADQVVDVQWEDAPVVIDGNLVTSQGPGTSFAFALALVQCIDGPEKAGIIAKGMIYG